MKKSVDIFSSITYLFSAILLFIMAITIMAWSVYEVFLHFEPQEMSKGEFISSMLQSVGAIVIAVAIIDVAKYMIEEEVYRSKELRSVKEARHTVTKIVVIISIAVNIEALVYIFKAGTEDLALLIYPASLLFVSVLLIVGLGVFQKLTVGVEKEYTSFKKSVLSDTPKKDSIDLKKEVGGPDKT